MNLLTSMMSLGSTLASFKTRDLSLEAPVNLLSFMLSLAVSSQPWYDHSLSAASVFPMPEMACELEM